MVVVKVSFKWWLRPGLALLVLIYRTTGWMPSPEQLDALIVNGTRLQR